MSRERKINVKVDTSNLPKLESGKNEGKINWKESVGCKVKFIYEDLIGEIEIVDRLDNKRLLLKYKDRIIEMESGNLIQGYLGKLLGIITNEFKYDVGTKINGFEIFKRYKKVIFENKRSYEYKYYTIKCLKCDTIFECKENDICRKKCMCSNNASYPEKFMYAMLMQLNIDFIYQYTKLNAKWVGDYKYDFYFSISGEEYIIETHGEQHYKENKKFKQSLEEVQKNDRSKYELAINNGIKLENYIVIDFRYSTLFWGKKNIITSKLNQIFNLNNIDWNICDEYKYNNVTKTDKMRNKKKITKEERIEINKKAAKASKDKNSHKVKVFFNNKLVGIFESIFDLSNLSEEVFGIKLGCNYISKYLDNEKEYNGFKFETATKEEWEHFNNNFKIHEYVRLNYDKSENIYAYKTYDNKLKYICEYWNNNKPKEKYLTTGDIGKIFNISSNNVAKYLTIGNELGLCNYDPKEEQYLAHVKASHINVEKSDKHPRIYINDVFLGILVSCHELERVSDEILNVKMNYGSISKACRDNKTYKGFTFEYATNEEYEEFKKEHPDTVEYIKNKYLQIIENIS